MPSPRLTPSSITLVHLISGDLVQVGDLEVARGSGVDIPPEFRMGDVVQCLRNDSDGVLIARGDGSRILVPPQSARKVEVHWFPESLEKSERSTSSPDPKASVPGVTARRWTGGPRPPRPAGTGVGPQGVEAAEPPPPR